MWNGCLNVTDSRRDRMVMEPCLSQMRIRANADAVTMRPFGRNSHRFLGFRAARRALRRRGDARAARLYRLFAAPN
jgi:hypothetical protein